MPTAATTTYSGNRLVPVYNAEDALRQPVKLPASVVYAKGTVLGELTATPGTFKAYTSGASDGSQIPKSILEYACATDASGNITLGGAATGGQFGETRLVVPAYFTGAFKTAELVQTGAGAIDANAVTVLGAHLVSGTLADGVIQIG
jgi:hypothetical protein